MRSSEYQAAKRRIASDKGSYRHLLFSISSLDYACECIPAAKILATPTVCSLEDEFHAVRIPQGELEFRSLGFSACPYLRQPGTLEQT